MSVRLFVGNLPYSATEVDIREHFGTVGNPIQIVIPTDRETGRPRGFAFVDYDDRGMAERAIQQLHGQPFKGRPLSVSEARPREARPPMGGGGFSSPPRPMGGPPRPMGGGGGGFSAPDAGGFRPRGGGADSGNRNFGPNKPPKGRGGSNFGKNRNQEGKAKGPLKERLSGRMFSVEEDARFRDARDADDTLVDVDVDLKDVKEEPEVEKDVDTDE
jgi:RNA recognition motif-containing protein